MTFVMPIHHDKPNIAYLFQGYLGAIWPSSCPYTMINPILLTYFRVTDPLFKSLNLLKLKDLFELSVLKLYLKFKHNSLPVYTLNMFTESMRNPYYNLRACGPLELANPSTVSGEKCLRCYLPDFINNSASEVLDKVNAHPYEGFSFFIRRTKVNSYRMNCTVPGCYICSNCPWIYPISISKFYFVLWCISRLPCSSID